MLKISKLFAIILFQTAFIFAASNATADVIVLRDSQRLNGLIIKRDARKTMLKNKYGTFSINNNLIEATIITGKDSSEDDKTDYSRFAKADEPKQKRRQGPIHRITAHGGYAYIINTDLFKVIRLTNKYYHVNEGYCLSLSYSIGARKWLNIGIAADYSRFVKEMSSAPLWLKGKIDIYYLKGSAYLEFVKYDLGLINLSFFIGCGAKYDLVLLYDGISKNRNGIINTFGRGGASLDINLSMNSVLTIRAWYDYTPFSSEAMGAGGIGFLF
jgi:hypothetical protein